MAGSISIVMTAATTGIKPVIVVGQAQYTTAGTYSWVAPAGTYSVSVVCVGGGGSGGGGGGLGWKNNISVTPGESYTVVVGGTSNPSGISADGSDSYFISNVIVKGGFGKGQQYTVGPAGSGGTYVGDGGGMGGNANSSPVSNYARGGGGAGGYTGNGGASSSGPSNGSSGSGGGGGGGAAALVSGIWYSGSGGGVGIYGIGTSGAGGIFNGAKGGGNGSTNIGNGTPYGGGGGNWYNGASGASGGAVRILWPGNKRSFPSTLTLDI